MGYVQNPQHWFDGSRVQRDGEAKFKARCSCKLYEEILSFPLPADPMKGWADHVERATGTRPQKAEVKA